MILAALALLARAAEPTAPARVLQRVQAGTDVRDLAMSEDGRWVGYTEGGGAAVHVLDTWTWTDTTVAACAGVRGLALTNDGAGAVLYTGCGDGGVVVIDVSASGIAPRPETLALGDGAILGLETDGATLWAVRSATGNPEVVAWDLGSGTLAEDTARLASSNVEDTAFAGTLLFVVHGGANVSKVDTRTMSAVQPQENFGGRDFVDAWAYTSGTVYLAESNGSLCVFNAGGNDLAIYRDDVAASVTAVHGDADAGWMLLGTGGDVRVLGFAGSPGSETGTIAGAGLLQELVGAGAWAYGGTSDGALLVLGDAPWVRAMTDAEGPFDTGSRVPITLTSDRAGDWELRVGGTLSAPGAVAAEGTVDADSPRALDIEVSDAFSEGTNLAWVFVRDGATLGHAAVAVTVDRAPAAPALTPGGVAFGDGRARVRFEGLTAEDLASYAIYVSEEPITAEDWPEGGPNATTVEAAPGEDVEQWIEGLENGRTYHVAARAFDAGGRSSPLSAVVNVTPQETYALSEQVGAGTQCGTSAPAGLLACALAGALALLRRRRGPTLLAIVASLVAVPARAGGMLAIEAGGGPVTFAEPLFAGAFGDPAGVRGHAGVAWGTRQLQVGGTLGAAPLSGVQVAADGTPSAEPDALLLAPASVEATLRLDVLRAGMQPVVPFVRAGADAWGWWERWAEDGGERAAAGLATGTHLGAGLMLKLDLLDPAGASDLEASTGIRDTWLVAEWRRARVRDGDFDLSGDTWGVSFVLDR